LRGHQESGRRAVFGFSTPILVSAALLIAAVAGIRTIWAGSSAEAQSGPIDPTEPGGPEEQIEQERQQLNNQREQLRGIQIRPREVPSAPIQAAPPAAAPVLMNPLEPGRPEAPSGPINALEPSAPAAPR